MKGRRSKKGISSLLMIAIIAFSVMSLIAPTATAAGEITATRDISDQTVNAGDTFTVTVEVTTNQDVTALALDEDLPSGWTVTEVDSAGAIFKNSTNEWLWMAAIPSGTTKTVIYNVTVPSDAAETVYQITGNVSAYGVSPIAVGGEDSVTVGVPPVKVVINEFLPNPVGTDTGDNEFIELYNYGDTAADITGWTLKDAFGTTTSYTITGTIEPGEFKVFWRNETGITLNNDEDMIYLNNSAGTIVDSYHYTSSTEGKSWARIPDGTGDFVEADPTPGAKNRIIEQADLIVTDITPKCGYLFANETNNITATIKNNGTADAGAFNVSFIIGEVSEEVRISGLAAGASEEVTVTDTTERNAGESVTIAVIADCDGEVTESNETNNATSIAKTVVNNGYKGKRFTGEEDITTLQTYTLNGNLVYSVGDSAYVSRDTGWTAYKANWTTSDLIPSGSTVVNARLYVYHHADRTPSENITDYFTLKFNGQEQSIDADYSDAKGFGSWDYSSPTGMVAYNVTDVFNMTTTNTVVLNNSYPGGGNVSIAGMVLLVVYSNSAEPERYIVINEGYDLLYAKEAYCVHSTEATAYAPFTGTIEDISNVTSAKLITVAPYGNSATMTKLFFNGQEWLGAWPAYVGSTNLGINEINVTVSETGNEARFQSYKPAGETKGDFMAASNAILVVTRGLPKTGDMDGNGVVNFNDVILLAKHYYFGDAVSDDPDVNSDGEVTFDDVILLAKHYYFGDTIYP